MFGLWNSARANKENILYAIVTIVLLERVRTGYNRLVVRGRRDGRAEVTVRAHQKRLLVKASFLYALPLLLPVVKYIYRSIEELSWSVPSLVVFKNTFAFISIMVLTELFLAFIVFNLLRIYVDRMNAAVGYFAKIGRNMWDGSKAAVIASGNVSNRVVDKMRRASASAARRSHRVALGSYRTVNAAPARALSACRGMVARVIPKRRANESS